MTNIVENQSARWKNKLKIREMSKMAPGLLAIRQAVVSQVNITYKLLYNDAVAMTGGQALDGKLGIPDLIQQLRGEGITRIALVSDDPKKYRTLPAFRGLTVNHRDDLIGIEEELRAPKGTTVLVYDQTCAAEKRRRRKKGLAADPETKVMINPAVCEGCGDCSRESNCLSVIPKETELGRKRQIDQSACNKDYSCLLGFCPSFVSVSGGKRRKSRVSLQSANLPALPLPKPAPVAEQPWNIVITGVGGTTSDRRKVQITRQSFHRAGRRPRSGCLTRSDSPIKRRNKE